MQKLPALEDAPRVETGAVQFGDDWPGLFIRGDECLALYQALQHLQSVREDVPGNVASTFAWIELDGLAKKLERDVIRAGQ